MNVKYADMYMIRRLAIPNNGIASGTAWEDIPEDWVCPLYAVGKDQFSKVQ